MAGIVLEGLSKWYGPVPASGDVSLSVDEGEFLVVLGPSGCGKTTTLRCLAGVEEPETGEIYVGDRCLFSQQRGLSVPAKDRNIGMVFQNYALYPHMTVSRNIEFGLKTRRVPKDIIRRRVREAIGLVGLEGLEERRPRELSGGQQQRVAVARTIAAQPDTLLFDEPLSNLDPELRVSLRPQLRHLHRKLGATSIYVTHDQLEAMVLADRIAVMENGRITQIAGGNDLYNFPATISVAEFTGNPKTNLIHGEVHRSEEQTWLIPDQDPYCIIALDKECRDFSGQKVVFHVRPEELELIETPEEEEGRLRVLAVMQEGADTLVHLHLGDRNEQLIAKSHFNRFESLKTGDWVGLRFHRGNIYSTETSLLVRSFGYGKSPVLASP